MVWKNIYGFGFTAQFLVFDEPSRYGIKRGKISKLHIIPSSEGWDKNVISYDRGWDVRITSKTPSGAVKLYNKILKKYN